MEGALLTTKQRKKVGKHICSKSRSASVHLTPLISRQTSLNCPRPTQSRSQSASCSRPDDILTIQPLKVGMTAPKTRTFPQYSLEACVIHLMVLKHSVPPVLSCMTPPPVSKEMPTPDRWTLLEPKSFTLANRSPKLVLELLPRLIWIEGQCIKASPCHRKSVRVSTVPSFSRLQ